TTTATHLYLDNGVYDADFRVTDDDGNTVIDSLQVTVVNVAPSVSLGEDIAVTEGEIFTLDVVVYDPGADTYAIEWDYGEAQLVSIGDNQIGLVYGDNGVYTVTATVTDDDGGESYRELQMNIQNTNDAPMITSSPETMAVENLTYYYNVSASDADSDTLNYSLDLKPDGMIMDSEGRITWTPTYQQASLPFMVMVNVSDGIDFDIQSYTITVINVNDKPSIISIPISSVTEDIYYSYDVEAVDVDIGDWLSYGLDAAPEGMSIDSSSGLLTWVPTNNQVGENIVVVNVTDPYGAFDIQEFTIIVMNSNDAPVLEDIGPLIATEGEAFSYAVSALDVDYGDTLIFSDNSHMLDINSSNGIITFTPSNEDVGIHIINITVTDSEGAIDFQNVLFTVNNVNDAPLLASIDPQTLVEDVPYTLVIMTMDIDLGETLVFSDNTTMFDIDSYSGIISFTPTNYDVGTYLVNISVKDKSGSFAYQTVSFTVNNVNDPPIIEPIGGLTATMGKDFSYTVTATELDHGDILTFSDDSEIFDIYQNTGEISFTPTSKDIGVHYVTLTVTDLEGESDQITFTFNILGEKEEEPFDFTLILLLIIVGLAAFFLGYMMNRSMKKGPPEEKEEEQEGDQEQEEIEMELLEEKPDKEYEGEEIEKEFPPPPPPPQEEGENLEEEIVEQSSEDEEMFEFETLEGEGEGDLHKSEDLLKEPPEKNKNVEPKAEGEDLKEEYTSEDKNSGESEE
ncbi:MAG: putative Ig domain-containing protein, partial [Thermoplasmata archaeon]